MCAFVSSSLPKSMNMIPCPRQLIRLMCVSRSHFQFCENPCDTDPMIFFLMLLEI